MTYVHIIVNASFVAAVDESMSKAKKEIDVNTLPNYENRKAGKCLSRLLSEVNIIYL